MAKILLEDVHGPFMVDREKGKQGVISEELGGGLVRHRIPGRFSVCGVTNGNNRRYPRSVWENNLKDGSHLRQLIATRAAFGTLEHPKDGQITLESPISHVVTHATLQENGEVHGEIVIIDCGDNSPGRKLKALIEVGYNPLVSSRGFGSLASSADGVDEVQDDYVCEGWDVVYKPSFIQAQLTPERHSTEESKVSTTNKTVVTENITPVANPSSPRDEEKPTGAVSSKNKSTRNIMDINTIREQLGALKVLVVSKLSAPQIAETFNQCQQLHRDVSAWGAEDGSRSWDATKLHEGIADIESALQKMHDAPVNEVAQLKEQQTKLLKLTKLVTEKAALFKKRLGENAARTASIKETAINAIGRGRDWRQRAIQLEAQVEELDLQLDVVSTTLDMLAEQYNSDVVKLSRAKIQIDYKDKLTPKLAEALKAASHPDEVYAVLEQLKRKQPASKSASTPVSENKGKASLTESKNSSPSAKEEGVSLPAARDPRSLNESIAITRRLSAAVVAA